MTEQEFWDAYESIRPTMKDYGDLIRVESKRFSICPICAVANKVDGWGPEDTPAFQLAFLSAAEVVGLDSDFAFRVAHAADNVEDHDPQLRARLLPKE